MAILIDETYNDRAEPRSTTKQLITSHDQHFRDDDPNFNFLTKTNNAIYVSWLSVLFSERLPKAVIHLPVSVIKSKYTNLPIRGLCAHSMACPTCACRMCTGWNTAGTLDKWQWQRYLTQKTDKLNPHSVAFS